MRTEQNPIADNEGSQVEDSNLVYELFQSTPAGTADPFINRPIIRVERYQPPLISGSSQYQSYEQQVDRELEWLVSSSEDQVDLLRLMDYIEALFDRAKSEDFEDGMESDFSSNLEAVILEFGNIALNTITRIIRDQQSNIAVICEALRKLGEIEHSSTHRNRLGLLGMCLTSDFSYVRDAASLGLASLDDPEAIPGLKDAIENEKNFELREDLVLVLNQLEETQQCLSS